MATPITHFKDRLPIRLNWGFFKVPSLTNQYPEQKAVKINKNDITDKITAQMPVFDLPIFGYYVVMSMRSVKTLRRCCHL